MSHILFFFFFNDTATPEIYTLSLHDALPISVTLTVAPGITDPEGSVTVPTILPKPCAKMSTGKIQRSEEHTSELQSLTNLVCRLLLEKKKKKKKKITNKKKKTYKYTNIYISE